MVPAVLESAKNIRVKLVPQRRDLWDKEKDLFITLTLKGIASTVYRLFELNTVEAGKKKGCLGQALAHFSYWVPS